MLFPEEERTDLRRRAVEHPFYTPLLAELRRAAAEAAATSPVTLPYRLAADYLRTGERRPFEALYFANRGRLEAAALVSLLDGDHTLIPTVQDYIWSICDEYSWAVPAHRAAEPDRPPETVVDLFAAETAFMLAELDSLLADRLDGAVRKRIRTEVERRVFVPYFGSLEPLRFESMTNNWAAVCAGSAGAAAVYLVEDVERLDAMIQRVLSSLDRFLAGFGDDGACPEGIGYWSYGFGFFVYFAELLRERSHGQVDLLADPRVRRIAAFPAAVRLGGEAVVSFSDAPQTWTPRPGLAGRLSARLGLAHTPVSRVSGFDDDHCKRWAPLVRDLFWSKPDAAPVAPADGWTYLPSVQWAVDRRQDPGGTLFAWAAKGGHNAEPHNHNDLGHFILHVGGETLLADLGAGLYTREYFGPERYTLIQPRSLGHSVPEINGYEQAAGEQYRATVLEAEAGPGESRFALDLTAAYPDPDLERYERSFRWIHPNDLWIEDSFRFARAPRSLRECFISFVRPEPAGAGGVRFGPDGGPWALLSFDPTQFSAVVEAIKTTTHLGAPLQVWRLALTALRPAPAMSGTFHFTLHDGRR